MAKMSSEGPRRQTGLRLRMPPRRPFPPLWALPQLRPLGAHRPGSVCLGCLGLPGTAGPRGLYGKPGSCWSLSPCWPSPRETPALESEWTHGVAAGHVSRAHGKRRWHCAGKDAMLAPTQAGVPQGWWAEPRNRSG